MKFEDILYTKENGVARLIINRPDKLNSFRSLTLEELTEAFADADQDRQIGVTVLTGAGDRSFCTGGDISEMVALTPDTGLVFLRKCLRLSTTMRALTKPIIAAVNGYCLGGGHEIHLFCDLTLAAEEAVFGQVGPTVGSVPIWGGTQLLPRIVGEKRAREIVFLCQRYSAREALNFGLVNKVVPRKNLSEEVEHTARRILEMSPQALRIARLSLNFEADLLYPSFLHGVEMLKSTYGSEELKEGMTAFLEKRKPDFARFRR
ncbi:MAG: enoyl-CoA hydratase-related protein [Proteobacteria bacterium]|jgi:dihydroxynaphthoic acid synthetase|nr:enoyl-CoA hydratase-related protein [Pseudomonadota bacterium]